MADITFVKKHTKTFAAYTQAQLLLTQYIFGAQLPQILELEIDVNNGHATSDGQDNYVTAGRFLERKYKKITLQVCVIQSTERFRLSVVFGIISSSHSHTSSTLGHSFQVHICLLAARLFMDTRQTVRASVPTMTSHGWEATSRP